MRLGNPNRYLRRSQNNAVHPRNRQPACVKNRWHINGGHKAGISTVLTGHELGQKIIPCAYFPHNLLVMSYKARSSKGQMKSWLTVNSLYLSHIFSANEAIARLLLWVVGDNYDIDSVAVTQAVTNLITARQPCFISSPSNSWLAKTTCQSTLTTVTIPSINQHYSYLFVSLLSQRMMTECFDLSLTCPSQSRRSLSNMWKIWLDGWWIVIITVFLDLRAKSFSRLIKPNAVEESRPEVGSYRVKSVAIGNTSNPSHK